MRQFFDTDRRLPAFTVIVCATALLFLISAIVQPQSLSESSIQGMLPFAARRSSFSRAGSIFQCRE